MPGLWFVGALGSVATVTMAGVAALRLGAARVGFVADRLGLDLPDPCEFVPGGHDVRAGTPQQSAREYARQNGVLREEWIAAMPPLEVRPGVDWTPEGDGPRLRDAEERLREDFRAFRRATGEAVVMHVASAEPEGAPFATERAFASALRRDDRRGVRPSMLYAYAAISEGLAFVNFTSSAGSSVPALDRLARRRGVPHMGRDGKTGETLVKAALAPMFAMRALRVHAWESHNLLGNRDGRTLADPQRARAKVAHKEQIVRALADPQAASHVRIDCVEALGDWKTAWDYVLFEGFLGVRMALQFTWQGNDSALAAPLVLDLARLAVFALRRGEGGAMRHLAFYFKDPYGVREHALARQYEALLRYARAAARSPGRKPAVARQ